MVIGGLGALAKYSGTPEKTEAAERQWPEASRLPRSPAATSLVMFVHPWCPCSKASLAELEGLLRHCGGRLQATVVFFQGEGVSDAALKNSLWRHAKRIHGVVVMQDLHGEETSRFHASVSGETFVFGRDGKLAFRGGITVARGHVGANESREAVLRLINHGEATWLETPVFGCPLHTPAEGDERGGKS